MEKQLKNYFAMPPLPSLPTPTNRAPSLDTLLAELDDVDTSQFMTETQTQNRNVFSNELEFAMVPGSPGQDSQDSEEDATSLPTLDLDFDNSLTSITLGCYNSSEKETGDAVILKIFPKRILRADKEVFLSYKSRHSAMLNSTQIERLKQLRRKERSCVYADKARHRRINKSKQQTQEIESLKQLVRKLTNENHSLRKQLELQRN